ncbi:hypothetical protein MPTK1_5g05040 [Marchantia polymorpha subsp. ruderalis]|nr:hypothetical protein MARPO_0027s0123 [Marchantia polymorpha]BBN10614.1 hypothetical protein Mp_5g05040 [Marchantia polymorpha subsp. ruderalis]|eukprot:PTQ43021.1 hypothetical protein MARPO_0027s0123 [Marchantia polymorpha]
MTSIQRELLVETPSRQEPSTQRLIRAVPDDIRFSESVISSHCSLPFEGLTLQEAVELVRSGEMDKSDFPIMKVLSVENQLWSLDNETLWVLRKARVISVIVNIVGLFTDPMKSPFYVENLYPHMSLYQFFPRLRRQDDVETSSINDWKLGMDAQHSSRSHPPLRELYTKVPNLCKDSADYNIASQEKRRRKCASRLMAAPVVTPNDFQTCSGWVRKSTDNDRGFADGYHRVDSKAARASSMGHQLSGRNVSSPLMSNSGYYSSLRNGSSSHRGEKRPSYTLSGERLAGPASTSDYLRPRQELISISPASDFQSSNRIDRYVHPAKRQGFVPFSSRPDSLSACPPLGLNSLFNTGSSETDSPPPGQRTEVESPPETFPFIPLVDVPISVRGPSHSPCDSPSLQSSCGSRHQRTTTSEPMPHQSPSKEMSLYPGVSEFSPLLSTHEKLSGTPSTSLKTSTGIVDEIKQPTTTVVKRKRGRPRKVPLPQAPASIHSVVECQSSRSTEKRRRKKGSDSDDSDRDQEFRIPPHVKKVLPLEILPLRRTTRSRSSASNVDKQGDASCTDFKSDDCGESPERIDEGKFVLDGQEQSHYGQSGDIHNETEQMLVVENWLEGATEPFNVEIGPFENNEQPALETQPSQLGYANSHEQQDLLGASEKTGELVVYTSEKEVAHDSICMTASGEFDEKGGYLDKKDESLQTLSSGSAIAETGERSNYDDVGLPGQVDKAVGDNGVLSGVLLGTHYNGEVVKRKEEDTVVECNDGMTKNYPKSIWRLEIGPNGESLIVFPD